MSKVKAKTKKTTDGEEKMHTEYLKYSAENEEKYGKKTIVLMECGSFYEVYSILLSETGDYINARIQEFADVCQMNIGPKKNVMDTLGQIVVAGFQSVLLEKYLPILTLSLSTNAFEISPPP